jgi:hypothetical protein
MSATASRPIPYQQPPFDRKERMRIFLSNRDLLTPTDFAEHVGKWVAISWDNTTILASDAEQHVLRQNLQTDGIEPDEVWFAYVPGDDAMIEHGSEIDIVQTQPGHE